VENKTLPETFSSKGPSAPSDGWLIPGYITFRVEWFRAPTAEVRAATKITAWCHVFLIMQYFSETSLFGQENEQRTKAPPWQGAGRGRGICCRGRWRGSVLTQMHSLTIPVDDAESELDDANESQEEERPLRTRTRAKPKKPAQVAMVIIPATINLSLAAAAPRGGEA
jgi:hypothetical protein